MTASSLKDPSKTQSGYGKLSGCSASCLHKEILGTGDSAVARSYTMLESFLEFMDYKCGGRLTYCQVRACTSRGNAGVHRWAWITFG